MFIGFTEPEQNWTKMPNQIATMEFSSLAEVRVIIYVLRHTWGYQEFGGHKRITLDEFERGRKRQDQSRIDSGTGMGRSSIRRGIESAMAHGYLERASDGRDAARQSFYYALRMRGSESNPPRERTEPPVDTKRAPDQRKKPEKETLLPAPLVQTPEGDYFTVTKEPEYTDLEDEISSPTRGPVASTPEQKRWLAACGHGNTLSFERGQKSKVKAILASVKRSDAMAAMQGDVMVYQQCLKELGSVNAASLKTVPSILPRSWYEDRLENAQKYGWSRQELLSYTVKRDKMIDHCRKKLRTLDAAPAQESPEEYATRTGKVVYS